MAVTSGKLMLPAFSIALLMAAETEHLYDGARQGSIRV